MKKKIINLVRICIFVVIFLSLLVHVSYMCRGTLSHSRNNLSGYYGLEKNSLDLVIFGTSGTFSSYAPMEAYEIAGFASYNFSTNVMGVDTMPYALKEIVKTQRPKAIVIDIYPFIHRHLISGGMLEDSAVRYNTDGYKYSLNRFNMISNIVPYKDKLTYYLDIFKYHENTFDFTNFFSETKSLDKGYNSLDYGLVREPVMTSEVIPLDPRLDVYLDKLVEECESIKAKYGTQIAFIYYPYADYNDEFPQSLQNVNYIENKLNGLGYEFINCQNFRDAFALDVSLDYWDAGHFNINGAEKVTRVVAPMFTEKFGLSDHRGEAAYTSWDDEVPYWEHNKEEYKVHVQEKMVEYYANLNGESDNITE